MTVLCLIFRLQSQFFEDRNRIFRPFGIAFPRLCDIFTDMDSIFIDIVGIFHRFVDIFTTMNRSFRPNIPPFVNLRESPASVVRFRVLRLNHGRLGRNGDHGVSRREGVYLEF